MATWVQIHNEVRDGPLGDWQLCFHQVTYHHEDGSTEEGYRFIWRRPDETIQAARGQARIPDAVTLDRLTRAARRAGWY